MKSKKPELKPCPSCGNDNQELIIITHDINDDNEDKYTVTCLDATCGTNTGPWDSEEIAIAKWNRRAI